MTISKAAQLVNRAGAIAKGSGIFLLDMGQPVRNAKHPEGGIEVVATPASR